MLLKEQYAREDRQMSRWGPNPVLSPPRERTVSPSPRRAARSPQSPAGLASVVAAANVSVSPARRCLSQHMLSPVGRQQFYSKFIARPMSPAPSQYY
jgi:hypothetical protein